MIFYKRLNDGIEKYSISSDKDMLMDIRQLVIDTCCEKTHVVQKNTCLIPKLNSDTFEIRNLETQLVLDSKFECERRYDIEYDCYKYPYLVCIIDGILNGDSSVLDELYNPTIDKKSVQERMTDLCSDMVKNIDSYNVDKEVLNKKLIELDTLRQLDPNQISPLEFYTNVRECLSIELEDSMSKSELDRIDFFFKDNTELLKEEFNKRQKVNIK